MNSKLNLIDGIIILFFCIIVLMRFEGIPDQYAAMFNFFNAPNSFPTDIYMNNTFFFDSSIYFSINNYLKLDQNDLTGLVWYFAVALIGACFLFLIIRDHFHVRDRSTILLIILCVGFLGRDIPVNTWGGVIPIQPGTATMFAKTMGIIVVYFLLKNRFWIASFIMTAIFSIHILGDFILFPVFVFFLYFNKDRKIRDIFSLTIPIAFLVLKAAASSNILLPSDDGDILFDAVVTYARQDADFLYQSKLALVLLGTSFVIFPLYLRRCNEITPELKNILWAIFIASLLLVIASTFYTAFGQDYFKVTTFYMLAPVRALNYYTLFFYLVSFVWIINNNNLSPIEKACLLVGLILLHGEGIKGILFPLIVIAGGFSTRILRPLFSLDTRKFNFQYIGVFMLAIVTAIQIFRGGVYNLHFDSLGWKYLNQWTVDIHASPEVWHSYSLLRNHKDDFPLLPVYLNNRGIPSMSSYLNIIGQKSFFITDGFHFYFNSNLWKEHLIRREATDKMLNAFRHGTPLQAKLINDLKARKVGIMVPKELANNFPASFSRKVFGTYELIFMN